MPAEQFLSCKSHLSATASLNRKTEIILYKIERIRRLVKDTRFVTGTFSGQRVLTKQAGSHGYPRSTTIPKHVSESIKAAINYA